MKTRYTQWMLVIISITLICFINTAEAKKRCRPLLEKLQQVQALQRNGYSAKKGQSLRAREDKARDNWWQCERSSSFKKSKKKKNSTKNKRGRGKKTVYDKATANKKTNNTVAPFASMKRIDVTSKYPRKKHFAWLRFYQKPQRCHRPKSLTVFAFCSENKLNQQADFERQYVK